jgi:hypothetical protein
MRGGPSLKGKGGLVGFRKKSLIKVKGKTGRFSKESKEKHIKAN